MTKDEIRAHHATLHEVLNTIRQENDALPLAYDLSTAEESIEAVMAQLESEANS